VFHIFEEDEKIEQPQSQKAETKIYILPVLEIYIYIQFIFVVVA
jgi:hypothetical protein